MVVLVGGVHRGVLAALAYARSLRPDRLIALSVVKDDEEEQRAGADAVGCERHPDVELQTLHSPFRELTRPVLEWIDELDARRDDDIITVVIPEFVVDHWWDHVLHNQSALVLKGRLLFRKNTVVTSVPWHLGSFDEVKDVEEVQVEGLGGRRSGLGRSWERQRDRRASRRAALGDDLAAGRLLHREEGVHALGGLDALLDELEYDVLGLAHLAHAADDLPHGLKAISWASLGIAMGPGDRVAGDHVLERHAEGVGGFRILPGLGPVVAQHAAGLPVQERIGRCRGCSRRTATASVPAGCRPPRR